MKRSISLLRMKNMKEKTMKAGMEGNQTIIIEIIKEISMMMRIILRLIMKSQRILLRALLLIWD